MEGSLGEKQPTLLQKSIISDPHNPPSRDLTCRGRSWVLLESHPDAPWKMFGALISMNGKLTRVQFVTEAVAVRHLRPCQRIVNDRPIGSFDGDLKQIRGVDGISNLDINL